MSAAGLALLPALLAALVDFRSRRIPDAIVLPSLAIVLAVSLWHGIGWVTVGGMVVAAGAGVGARIAARGGFGAGDVKLLAYCGAVVGLAGVGSLLLGTAIGGGVLGLAYLLRAGKGATVPYGVAIAIGLSCSFAAS